MKSSGKKHGQILGVMSARRAEACLLDWANVRHTPKDEATVFLWLFKKYPEVFPKPALPATPTLDPTPLLIKVSAELMSTFSDLLRRAWDARTLREREWYLDDAASLYHLATDRFGHPPTQATPLEALLYYFRRNAERALHCPNPACMAPYFFATKKGQKYCSPECAAPSQRESKRKWWHENRAKGGA